MITYLYAVVDDLPDVSGVMGVGGEPLRLAAGEGLTVVIGDLSASPRITHAMLIAQDRVVRLLHERAAALLPMRFGAGFATMDAAWSALAVHQAGLRDRLTQVRHREQMTLRITRADAVTGTRSASGETSADAAAGASEAEPTSGAAYLRSRARPPEIAALLDALAPHVHAGRVEPGRSRGMVATVYHLITRGTSETYRQSVHAFVSTQTTHLVRVSGPSPCSAFG